MSVQQPPEYSRLLTEEGEEEEAQGLTHELQSYDDEGQVQQPLRAAGSTASKGRRSRRRLLAPFVSIALLIIAIVLLRNAYYAWKESEKNSKDRVNVGKPGGIEDDKMGLQGKAVVGYFTNWGIYGRKYPPSSVPSKHLTHILYSFANVRPETGEVYLTDLWSDEQIHYPDDSWDDQGENLYGNLKQFYLLKKQNRHLKVLLSIGGWTYSSNFPPAASDPAKRAEFVRSGLKLLEDYGLDGLDLDWEYPADDAQARDYVSLLAELRQALDQHAHRKGDSTRYLLSIAAPCGEPNYRKLHLREMDRYLDMWNLMAYDYAGNWDSVAGHQANLFGPPPSTASCIQYYTQAGVPPHKLVMGMPLYGRGFQNTDGAGKSYNGVGEGSWEAGSWDYKVLPLPGAQEYQDDVVGASYSYDSAKREFITYDTPQMASNKASWINGQGLGGAMFWELSGDRPEGDPRAIVPRIAYELGRLDGSENHLVYRESKWENMRKGME